MTSQEKADVAARAAEDLKANRIVMLDVEGQTHLADFFVICSGTSDVHIRAIANNVIDMMLDAGFGKPTREGIEAAEWVLLDYGDVIVHIFMPEARDYYKLESFWSGAKVIELVEETRAREPALAG